MFERRLKIFLMILFTVTLLLAGRAAHVQVIGHAYWDGWASAMMRDEQLLETIRGSILDYRGRPIAIDVPCIDAAVDYRAIVFDPDPAWIRSQALIRLRNMPGNEYRSSEASKRRQMLRDEMQRVEREIEQMWKLLAEVSGHSVEEIYRIRQDIVTRIEMRRRYNWYWRYQRALQQHENRPPPPWYRQWLIDPNREEPQLDRFEIDIREQTEPHVILRAVSTEVHNTLAKNLERLPGLVLQPSTHRHYPYGHAASHVIGRLSRVSREDLETDPFDGNPLRQYYPNDLIGRTGLESLLEPHLRGTRGRVERLRNEQRILGEEQPVAGRDVRTTLDIELQNDIEQLFRQHAMHGGVVVIDVTSGAVRALVSSPTFDLNELGRTYAQLVQDEINRPLFNRATQAQLEPGSTVKLVVGLGAVTQGVVRHDQGIECTGYLVIGGRRFENHYRCWVASQYGHVLGSVAHHPIPSGAAHSTGFLDLADAIERSCNIYFETVADQLRIEGLSYWFERFGLGRPTGIGIAEAAGRLPSEYRGQARRPTAWLASIGQGTIAATPLQMANVAATVARDGVWMAPRLFVEAEAEAPPSVDLGLSREALAAAKVGMTRAVENRSGTGYRLKRGDVRIAGKTGSAQASPFSVPLRDEHGQIVLDENGRVQRRQLVPGTSSFPNPEAPWYRFTGENENNLTHGWFIGFAPAGNPQVAFAVMVEYGGSGGRDITAAITAGTIEACVEHGYLSLERRTLTRLE